MVLDSPSSSGDSSQVKCSSCPEKIIFSAHPDPHSSAVDRALHSPPNLCRPHRACSPGPWTFIKKMNLYVISCSGPLQCISEKEQPQALTSSHTGNQQQCLVLPGFPRSHTQMSECTTNHAATQSTNGAECFFPPSQSSCPP